MTSPYNQSSRPPSSLNTIDAPTPQNTKPLPLVTAVWTLGVLSVGYALSRLYIYASSITEIKPYDLQQLELNRKITQFLRSPMGTMGNTPLPLALAQIELANAAAFVAQREQQLKRDARFSPFFQNPRYSSQSQQTNPQMHRAHISSAHSASSTSTPPPTTPLIFPKDQKDTKTLTFGTSSNDGVKSPSSSSTGVNDGYSPTSSKEHPQLDPNLTPFEIFQQYLVQKQCVEYGFLSIEQISNVVLQICEHYATFQKISSLPLISLNDQTTINVYEPIQKYFEQFSMENGFVALNAVQDLVEMCILEIALGDISRTIF